MRELTAFEKQKLKEAKLTILKGVNASANIEGEGLPGDELFDITEKIISVTPQTEEENYRLAVALGIIEE